MRTYRILQQGSVYQVQFRTDWCPVWSWARHPYAEGFVYQFVTLEEARAQIQRWRDDEDQEALPWKIVESQP